MAFKETWNTRLGVILAVSGSAVGLGNFLRFPGQVAQYGGGAFMLAYFISFLIIGLPICWAEWTMGRTGGQNGFNSSPGILQSIIKHPAGRFIGVIGVLVPLVIYLYYVYIEAWCLGYSLNFLRGAMEFGSMEESSNFWSKFIGAGEDGSAIGFGITQVGGFLVFCFALNFFLIYRGLSKGIEFFCTYAMPALVAIAIIILLRVMTLGAPDASKPEQSIVNGLGYLWNPTKVILQEKKGDSWETVTELVSRKNITASEAMAAEDENLRIARIGVLEQLRRPSLWLAAAGQIFFSLSVGFGVIITYASYLKKEDDIVLSGLSATSANEFCEVSLGGLITIPPAYAFIGIAGVAGMGTFGLGFNVLPMVFSNMPLGNLFGFLFFFLLFLAAVTSSLSMLQPVIAFLEESLGINRKASVAILGLITALGSMFVVYFSADVKALDTLDFWIGTFMLYVLATIQIIVFGWVIGIDEGFRQAHQGASMQIPSVYRILMKFLTPAFLLFIIVFFIMENILGWTPWGGENQVSSYVTDLVGGEGKEPNTVARLSVVLIAIIFTFLTIITAISPKFKQYLSKEGAQ